MKKYAVLLLAMTFLVLCGFKVNLGTDDKVLVKVGDSKITIKEFNEKIAAMPAQYKEYYNTAEGKKQLIENLKKEFLILETAKKEKYETNKDVIDQINKIKSQVIGAVYLREKIDKVVVSKEDDVKKYYADNKAEFKTKDQVKAKHILVKTEDEAKAIIAKLAKGDDFGALATEYSLDPSGKTNKGELGWFSVGQMVKPFETAAFALEKGKYTKAPVQTQYGWHVILVEDKKDAADLTFEEAKEDIKNFLTQKSQKEILDKIIAGAEKKIKVEDQSEQLLLKK